MWMAGVQKDRWPCGYEWSSRSDSYKNYVDSKKSKPRLCESAKGK